MGKVQGAASLQRKLKRFPDIVRAEVKAAILESAAEIVAAQKRLAPKKSGKLAESITFTTGDKSPPAYATIRGEGQKGDPELTALISAGNTRVRYAHLVEFGTAPHVQGGLFDGANPAVMHPGSPAKPFFYPGYRLTRKKAKSRVSRAVSKAAKKAAAG